MSIAKKKISALPVFSGTLSTAAKFVINQSGITYQATIGDFVAVSNPSPQKGLQVGADHRLYGPDGKRLFIRGAQEFTHCLSTNSTYFRPNAFLRSSSVSASAPNAPIGRGDPYGKWLSYSYVSEDAARAKIAFHRQWGLNTVRLWVGTGMIYTEAFTDAVTGLSFPTELEVLDSIVDLCARMGMIVWMSNDNRSVSDADLATFWTVLATRYANKWNVIIDISNEPGTGTVYTYAGSTGVDWSVTFNTDAHWIARFGPCLTAIRAAGFTNPVAVQPYGGLWWVNNIATILDGTEPFASDPNLIVSWHLFWTYGDVVVSWDDVTKLPGFRTRVENFGTSY